MQNMIMTVVSRIRIFILILLCILSYNTVRSQDIAIKSNSYFYPHKLEPGTFIHTLGLRLASLPEDIVESDDAFRAPLISYKAKLGITKNFLAESSAESNLITLHLVLGPRWTYEFDKLNISLGGDAAFFLGAFDQSDFKTKISGWFVYPNISAGYLFPNFSISLKSELIFVLDQSVKIENVNVTSDFKTFSGYSLALFLEQPLWKDNFLVIGFKTSFTKFYYPMWVTFSTFDKFLFIPEIIFSFNL